ncbi:hypothetical protein BS47DRAFT_1366550 [Hydnum rufescens UP504]|uniref:Uncharacterized protein n=1 Tax=Hydnum rufescens UP504 TaxID=1448309 RepID=A0A9P6DRG0_9AGAM|nr:hypothetical protein BS47DRAFT_1366550 [Hydnum rufescens UP504]
MPQNRHLTRGSHMAVQGGLQQPIKHHIQCQCLEDLVSYSMLGKSSTEGWDLTFKWLQDNPSLVQLAWKLCTARNWNLLYECLMSAKAVSTVLEHFDEDPSFALQVTPLSDGPDTSDTIDHPESTDFDQDDDTSLPTTHLAQVHLDPRYTSPAMAMKPAVRPKKFKINNNLFALDESGHSYQIISLFDEEELTNKDAEGETDPEDADESETEVGQNGARSGDLSTHKNFTRGPQGLDKVIFRLRHGGPRGPFKGTLAIFPAA